LSEVIVLGLSLSKGADKHAFFSKVNQLRKNQSNIILIDETGMI